MAKRKTSSRRSSPRYFSKKRTVHRKPVFHAVPDLLAVGAPLQLLNESQTLSLVQAGNWQTAGQYLMDNLTTVNGLKAPVTLLAGSLIASYIGKNSRLGKIGSKNIKLF